MGVVITAGLAAFISGVISLVTVILQRKWKKQDDEASGNKAIIDKLKEIAAKLDDHISEDEMYKAKAARIRILRFNDEVIKSVKHTEEHWSEILDDIDIYEKYCALNPSYPNNKAVMAIENLKRVYSECMRDHKFI